MMVYNAESFRKHASRVLKDLTASRQYVWRKDKCLGYIYNTSNGGVRAHSKIAKRNIGGFAHAGEAATWLRQFGQHYVWWSEMKHGQRVPGVEPNDYY